MLLVCINRNKPLLYINRDCNLMQRCAGCALQRRKPRSKARTTRALKFEKRSCSLLSFFLRRLTIDFGRLIRSADCQQDPAITFALSWVGKERMWSRRNYARVGSRRHCRHGHCRAARRPGAAPLLRRRRKLFCGSIWGRLDQSDASFFSLPTSLPGLFFPRRRRLHSSAIGKKRKGVA